MTLQSPTATLIPLISSSELTGCGYPGLLDRKNRSDMCPRWESNPRLPACKASTLSTRPGSPLRLKIVLRATAFIRLVTSSRLVMSFTAHTRRSCVRSYELSWTILTRQWVWHHRKVTVRLLHSHFSGNSVPGTKNHKLKKKPTRVNLEAKN